MCSSASARNPSVPAAGVEHHLSELRIHLLHDEADHRPRSVELARVAGRISHLPQHRLVEMRHRVDVVGRGEVHAVDYVDHIAEKVAGQHPIEGLLEHRRQDIARVSLSTALQIAQLR
jgi:hypothetical protein